MQADDGRRVAIVTGAARRIGAAIARHLHHRGLNVVVHYRSAGDAADALARELNEIRTGSVTLIQADLCEPAAPAAITSAALDTFGRLDVLVHNASTFFPTKASEPSRSDWDELMDSNLRGPYFLSTQAAPQLARRQGSIVNLVDIHGWVPLKDHSIYCQAKAGLIMQTRALAKDLAPKVRVNAVAPGAILWPEAEAALSDKARRDLLKRIPLARQGSSEDIAGAVAFLALDAPYITGQILAVDGGRVLSM